MKAAARSSSLDHLVDRIRLLLEGDPRISEKQMFGGLTFLLNGHILVGCKKDGRILLSVGREHNDAALARPGATQMMHRDRPMTGFVWIDADAIEDDDDLADWVRTTERWVAQMPIEAPKPRKRSART